MESNYKLTKHIGSYRCGAAVWMKVCGGVPKQAYNKFNELKWSCTGGVLDETVYGGEEESDLDVEAGGLVVFCRGC